MKFANINPDGFVRLTKAGYEFAKLVNPLIDEDMCSANTLSIEEKEFYIKFETEHVPEEGKPIYTIDKIIFEGNHTLEAIDKEIKTIKPEWTDAVVVTQRAGTLGRMYELDLVRKTKNGINVSYFTTDFAKQIL